MKGYDIKIRVKDFRPITWRDLIIPEDMTFIQLHEIIQVCFGFGDWHLHQFSFKNNSDMIENWDLNNYGDTEDSHTTKIKKYFDTNSVIEYWYDFGDDWKITIEVKKKVDYDKNYPTFKRFKGEYNMMEDIGGPWRLEEIIYYLESDYESGLKQLLNDHTLDIDDLEPTDIHHKYYNTLYADEKLNSLSDDEFFKELDKFSLEFIKDNNLTKEYEEFSKENNSLDDFLDKYVKTYEKYEIPKFDMDYAQEYIKKYFENYELNGE